MSDHYLCLGAMALELAAFTPFFYLIEARELMCDLLDALCGARVTTNFIRIGGVSADLPDGFDHFAVARLDRSLVLLGDADKLLTQNPVFRERMEGTGHLAPEDPDRVRRDRSAAARRAACPTTCAACIRISCTESSISTFRLGSTATISTATW